MSKYISVISFLAICLLFGSANAADERFTVDINVDVTDVNASTAREKAMREANKAAVLAVTKRVSTADGVAQMSELNEHQLLNFIKETSVVEEKNSPVRYIAHLKIVLNEDILKQYMKERDIPLLLTDGGKILVIPVFREFSSDAPMLWESTNLWKQAWDNATNNSAISFLSLPAEAAAYVELDANKALAMDGEALSKIIRAYNAADAYVLDAHYNGIEGLIIRATSYNGDSRSINVAGSRSLGDELFANAVAETKKQIEAHISEQSISENSLENTMTVLYNFNQLGQWVATERALNNTPVITKIETQAFANNKAQLRLTYTGSEDKLNKLLNNQGYSLQNQGSFFSLVKD